MSDTPATIRGIQIKKWGTNILTGYIVAEEELVENGGYFPIEDEVGNFVTDVSKYGKSTEITLNVIPISTQVKPLTGDVFTCPDGMKIIIRSLQIMRSRKNPEMWKISGTNYDFVT